MSDTTTCRRCGAEGAYFDGWCYVCEECGYEWGDQEIDDDDDDDD